MKSLIALGLAALLTFGTTTVAHAGVPASPAGSYSGIIGVGGAPGDQGRVTITITSARRYTLRGRIAGIGFSHKGELPESNQIEDGFILRLLGGLIRIPVDYAFVVAPEQGRIAGLVRFEFQGELTDLTFFLHKAADYTRTSPAPQAGRHVIVLTPEEGGVGAQVPGRGVATVKVSPTGLVKVSGALADGAKISCGGRLAEDGTFPILNVLYRAKGYVAGFAKFDEVETPELIDWVRVVSEDMPLFRGKLGVNIHRYTPPAAGTPAIAFGNPENTGPLGLSGGGLTNFPLTNIQVSNRNRVTVVGENESRLKLQINKNTGLISGSIRLEIGDKTLTRAIKLVILQDLDIAQGFFLSPEPEANADLGLL